MVKILRPSAGELEPLWPEMRRLWRQDGIRRRHKSGIEDVKRGLILGLLDVWIAWENEPTDIQAFGGPHYCLALIVTTVNGDGPFRAYVAAGRSLKKWTHLMASRLIGFAWAMQIYDLVIYCRKGWSQELKPAFGTASVTFYRDPLLLDFEPAAFERAG